MNNTSLIFVTGGARSGKSTFAERLALNLGGDRVTYIATAEVLDGEMVERVKRHQAQRPSQWETVEEPIDLVKVLDSLSSENKVVLIDCLSLYVSNLLFKNENLPREELTEAVLKEVSLLGKKAKEIEALVIIVSNEVGMSIVPENHLARLYRDLLGWANQRIAKDSDETYLVTAGISIELKGLAVKLS